MTLLSNFGLVSALAFGVIGGFLFAAVVLARMGLAVRAWLDRNN